MEDFFFLPTMRSFTRELGESILATPSGFSVNNHRYGCGHGSGLSARPGGRDLLRQQYVTAKERMPRRKEVHKQQYSGNQTD